MSHLNTMTSQLSREPPPINLANSLSTYSTINSYVLHEIKYNPNLTMQEIRNKIKVTDRTKTGRSYLNYAVRYGKMHLVQGLIEMGASLSIRSHCDWNVLHDAAFFHRLEIAEWLLREVAGSWQLCLGQDKFGNTPIHMACRRGNRDIARLMVQEMQTREIAKLPKNCMNHTWLHSAIHCRMQDVVELLLSVKDGRDSQKKRALWLLSGVDAFLTSPLQQCCLHPRDEMLPSVHFILQCVENYVPNKNHVHKIVTYQDETKSNCIQYCFASTSVECCITLMEFYAKYASQYLTHQEMLELNPLTARNVFGFTVLHIACRFQQIEILRRFLLEYTPSKELRELYLAIDTNVEDVTGKPPVLLATEMHREEARQIFEAFEERKRKEFLDVKGEDDERGNIGSHDEASSVV